jgi:hypothetical protein
VEKFQPGSAGTGETMKPIGGARVAVTEGEGVIVGLCKLEEETAFGKYAKVVHSGMGRLARLRGRMGQLAAGPIGPKVKEKFFSK